jgi:hypothetical protein
MKKDSRQLKTSKKGKKHGHGPPPSRTKRATKMGGKGKR